MKRWIIYPKKSDNIIEQLLINRGIKDRERFLNPDYEKDIHNPFLLKGMDKAVKRIQRAIKNKEKVGIFADYDADGIPGAALLTKVFKLLDLETVVYIPTRDEGYGLNESGVRDLSKRGCKLLITVDLGIINKKEVVLAKKLRMDVIITDHHEFTKEKVASNALVVLHPKLSPKYSNKDLAGGGVAFKFAQALSQKLGKPTKNELKWLLELPAISTVCDCVEILGENRTIVKYGLVVLRKSQNIGLQALYKEAKITPETIDTYNIGFQIGPRINAPGRMSRLSVKTEVEDPRPSGASGDQVPLSFQFLVTKDPEEAHKIAQKLNKINYERQQELDRVLQEAEAKIKTRKLHKNKIILVEGKDWPLGIIGLVAGKLMNKYSRPVIVFKREEDISRGSARSIDGFHILEALEKTKKYLLAHGGHAQAAGVSLENQHLATLYDELLEIAEVKIKFSDLTPKISVDAIIEPKDITFKLYNELKKFEPHGIGNPRPIFLMKNMIIKDKKMVGRDQNHIKLKVSEENNVNEFDAIGFNFLDIANTLSIGLKVDLVFSLEENVFNGKKTTQLKLLDLHESV